MVSNDDDGTRLQADYVLDARSVLQQKPQPVRPASLQ